MSLTRPGFVRVHLVAPGGEVALRTMPAFFPPPEIVTWGGRTFRLAETATEALRYGECFAVALVDLDELALGEVAPEVAVRVGLQALLDRGAASWPEDDLELLAKEDPP